MKRLLPIALDLVIVLVFAIVGRASHNSSPFIGALGTAWPFLAAGLVAWAIVAVLGDTGLGWRGWLIIWLVTLAGGMALRVAAGGTTAPSFVLVAGIFLGSCFGIWRAIAAWRTKQQAA